MHREECEDSWRPAGFRVLDRTRFLACCAMKGHKCWDQTYSDPPPLDDDVPPPKSALDKALVEHIQTAKFCLPGAGRAPLSDASAHKANKLLSAGADAASAMYATDSSYLTRTSLTFT